MKKTILLLSFFLCTSNFAPMQPIEKRIVIVIASYNNQDWYESNLRSVLNQKYTNYQVIYINDASTDRTKELVEAYLEKYDLDHHVYLINNEKRQGALANQYRAIHACNNNDIIIILDGDDQLAHDQVLSVINKVYADPTIWLTYGQFKEFPSNRKGFCRPFPAEVIKNNTFRSHAWVLSHLRTFYAGLFKKIKREDLQLNAAFLGAAPDVAIMFPMVEMARDNHFKYLSEVLYIYNRDNVLNEGRTSDGLQRKIDLMIRAKTPYEKIESPF